LVSQVLVHELSYLDDRGLGSRLECISKTALPAVLSILVEGHEDSCAALSRRAFTAEALNLAIRVDLVVLEDRHLDLLALVLDLFGGAVSLLLALLATTTEAKH